MARTKATSRKPASTGPTWNSNRSSLGAARSIWVPNDVYDALKVRAATMQLPVSEIYVSLARLYLAGELTGLPERLTKPPKTPPAPAKPKKVKNAVAKRRKSRPPRLNPPAAPAAAPAAPTEPEQLPIPPQG